MGTEFVLFLIIWINPSTSLFSNLILALLLLVWNKTNHNDKLIRGSLLVEQFPDKLISALTQRNCHSKGTCNVEYNRCHV